MIAPGNMPKIKPLNGDRNVNSAAPVYLPAALETPTGPALTALSDEEKIQRISRNFEDILLTLGLDLDDDSLRDTPKRVAKMYVQELFRGLRPDRQPTVSRFENKYAYGEMLLVKDIRLESMCEHHLMPIRGKVHVAYIPQDRVVGLSKLNRIVDYYAHRPQVQERLTGQIAEHLKQVLETEDIAVFIDSEHMCVSLRGIHDPCSATTTQFLGGAFRTDPVRREFFDGIRA